VEGVSVLVVDDSPEIIHLLQRYTTGTRYHVTGLEDPEQVFQAIESSGARLIVLDVMMPKIDGWELLGRLRQHPLTQHIPVIILSILAQEELALSLGARALVVKPVTQEKFLAVMDQVSVTLN
jgi:CheY-like chemotaxis protein